MTISRIAVRYAETDRMGVVHHAVYPIYFEVGRTDFFARHLVPYDEMERAGLRAVVIEVGYRLRGTATYGDELLVRTRPDSLRGVRLQMSYEVRRARDGALVVEGFSRHALVGPEGRPVHPRRFAPYFERIRKVFP